ncbi:MAG: cytochrome c biogenesis protein CcdA, partial [Chloroflexi bacterium]|nr:cytochrome c biogenesis protein CcdA [Chloroflexota bacterium]
MEAQISLAVAFGAGMLSFLSPCVLPLVPAYIGHLSGVSLREESYNRLATFVHALAFVAGFSVIFVAIWVAIGLAGYVVAGYKDILRLVGGAVLILMGLHIAGVLRFSFLDREARMQVNPARGSSLPMSFLVGVVFAAGWTPCIGP